MEAVFIRAAAAPCVDFKGFTLVLVRPEAARGSGAPAVSVGNVGQLAVDLIVSTLALPAVGYIHTDCLVPVAGNNPYATTAENSADLCTSSQVYASADQKLAVLQIRSPIVQGKACSFRHKLISWIKESGFSKVVLLSSSHAYQRIDKQLVGSLLRFVATPALQSLVGEEIQALNWTELERVSAFPGISEAENEVSIPGGGITTSLYKDSCAEGIPLAVLLIFCSEGDNIPDAFCLLNFLNEWLQLTGKLGSSALAQWKVPSSWRLLFGSGIPPALF
ncbi:proteasome assembly chaperone 2 isoform X2 [Callorhinchus milii]|uniref:proteasome assembly chaperone 2 isoform X2 n=1 Tax=Callorhinchus milii TaxID=7868 RepID=UPI001C3FC670|nr:proteasome assembly chaperone 2 isoform X2 [Callorhinchus milii]